MFSAAVDREFFFSLTLLLFIPLCRYPRRILFAAISFTDCIQSPLLANFASTILSVWRREEGKRHDNFFKKGNRVVAIIRESFIGAWNVLVEKLFLRGFFSDLFVSC